MYRIRLHVCNRGVSEVLAIALLNNHELAYKILTSPTPPAPPQAQASQGPKLEQPIIDVGISIEE